MKLYSKCIEVGNKPDLWSSIQRHFADSSYDAISDALSCCHNLSCSYFDLQLVQVLCCTRSDCVTTVAEEGQI